MRYLLKFTVLVLAAMPAACMSKINSEDFFRYSAAFEAIPVKTPFGNFPIGFETSNETIIVDVSPDGILGVEKAESIKKEIVERADGFVAGYKWARANPGTQDPPCDDSRSESWMRGFGWGETLSGMERQDGKK